DVGNLGGVGGGDVGVVVVDDLGNGLDFFDLFRFFHQAGVSGFAENAEAADASCLGHLIVNFDGHSLGHGKGNADGTVAGDGHRLTDLFPLGAVEIKNGGGDGNLNFALAAAVIHEGEEVVGTEKGERDDK